MHVALVILAAGGITAGLAWCRIYGQSRAFKRFIAPVAPEFARELWVTEAAWLAWALVELEDDAVFNVKLAEAFSAERRETLGKLLPPKLSDLLGK